MPDRKISELSNIVGEDLANDDEFVVVDTSADETKAITYAELILGLREENTALGNNNLGLGLDALDSLPDSALAGERNTGIGDSALTAITEGDDNTTLGYQSGLALTTQSSNTLIGTGAGKLITDGVKNTILGRYDGNQNDLDLRTSDNNIILSDGDGRPRVHVNSTGTASFDGNISLNAIAKDISDTAVDVVVYDTRKDSDGGAWRKRTQHTSWYNETLSTSTRGFRKEFPAVAVIVAEATQVTIYDGDDPDLPMWMVFDGGSASDMLINLQPSYPLNTIDARNGRFTTGIPAFGMHIVNFISDTGEYINTTGKRLYSGTITERNDAKGIGGYLDANGLINGTVNDVAMTVLPNAPIDAATGLPVPTIAVGTGGGVSVINDDGTVADSAEANTCTNVFFDPDGNLYRELGNHYQIVYNAVGSYKTDSFSRTGFWTDDALYDATNSNFEALAYGKYKLLSSTNQGGFYKTELSAPRTVTSAPSSLSSKYLVNRTTSSYNTGWMNGDIKLATLSDTDDTDVTGSELVTNGDFSSALSGTWTTDLGSSSGGTVAIVSGELVITQGTNSVWMGAYQAVDVSGVDTVTVSAERTAVSGGGALRVGLNTTANISSSPTRGYVEINGTDTGLISKTFDVSGDTTLYLTIAEGSASGRSSTVDNVTLRLAEEDRSVNGNGLQVFGTVTKDPVATGADLVAYSGFSNVNYLYQPYNSDLDFGTGDFCLMGWANHANASANQEMVSRGTSSGTSFRFMYRPSNPDVKVQIGGTSNVFTETDMGGFSLSTLIGIWAHFVALRRSGVVEIYINGEFKASEANTEDVTRNINEYLILGNNKVPSNSLNVQGSMAFWRISATAPSPEQIKKIYEDEKVLFQDGAQATLYGSSDAVTALAYDDSTELLHVGTSAGRSVFQGLKRVENTTDAVGAAISASNGLVAED